MAWIAASLALLALAYPGYYADAQTIPAPHTGTIEPISFNLLLVVQRIEILNQSIPVPHMARAAAAPAPEIKIHKKEAPHQPSFAYLVGDGAVGLVETVGSLLSQPRTPSVHIVYAKDYEEPAVFEPISNALTAAVVVANSYIKNLPAPEALPVTPVVHTALLSNKNIFVGVEMVNELLGGFNSRMFATYKKAGTDFAAAAVFDVQAVAHVWDKTFAEFGKRFAHDVYALGATQKNFYMQSAAALQGSYNIVADEVAKAPTLGTSISVASVAYTPSLTAAVGDSSITNWWGSAVDFVGNLFFASSEVVAEKFALQKRT